MHPRHGDFHSVRLGEARVGKSFQAIRSLLTSSCGVKFASSPYFSRCLFAHVQEASARPDSFVPCSLHLSWLQNPLNVIYIDVNVLLGVKIPTVSASFKCSQPSGQAGGKRFIRCVLPNLLAHSGKVWEASIACRVNPVCQESPSQWFEAKMIYSAFGSFAGPGK